VVITLLAVVGMNIANTELAGATSEQVRLRAFNAAETGLETRIQTLRNDATTSAIPEVRAAVAVENSPLNTMTGVSADTYATTTIYRGEGTMLSRFSAAEFVGFHYSIESVGRSMRNSESVHTAGAFLVASIGAGTSWGSIASGTAPVVAIPAGGLGSTP
jgi:Tfp pilus assembly protein PilX